MKNKLPKKSGFTLIEIVVTMAVIVIISMGMHAMYVRMIRDTKMSEEKQRVSVNGKRVLEDIKSIKNDDIVFDGDAIEISNLPFIKEADHVFSNKKLKMDLEDESFSATVFLDEDYEYCEESSDECVYEEKVTISKIKASDLSGGSSDVDINMDVDNINEDIDEINKNINPIGFTIPIKKTAGEDDGEIDGSSLTSDGHSYVLNLYIEKDHNGDGMVIIKDSDGTVLYQEEDIEFNSSKINHLNIKLDYGDYLIDKEDTDDISKVSINVYNTIKESDNVVSNLYILDSAAEVDVKPCKGEIYKHVSDGDGSGDKIGILYSVNVEITSKKTGEKLFLGREVKNMDIKDK